MRPEQRTLFQSLIPKNFMDAETKFSDIIDQEEKDFNERRLKNLKMRQERINKNKKDTKLQVNDYVVVKSYGDTIGVSRKLKSVYDNIPFKIISIKYYNCVLLNILDGSQILRAVDDIKKIEVLDSSDSNFNNIPKEVFAMLNIITMDNIVEIFSNKKDETPLIREPRTRSKLINDIDREKQLLMDEMLDLDSEEIDSSYEKHVTFLED
jgi:hypothetical protein